MLLLNDAEFLKHNFDMPTVLFADCVRVGLPIPIPVGFPAAYCNERKGEADSMIKGVLIVNNHGKPRLAKFYQNLESEEQQQTVIRKVFQQVSQRPDSFCNYLEGVIPEWGDTTKIIYRHYATLYFIFAVDSQESDLGILDLIQVFVEALDKSFENVCELDLIFHSDRVHYILDEIIMAGMVLETNINQILTAINEQNKLHTSSLTGR